MAKPWLVKVRALFIFLQNVSYEKRMPRFETPPCCIMCTVAISISFANSLEIAILTMLHHLCLREGL